MPKLKIKSTHKVIKHYYAALEDFDRLGVSHESAVRSAFQSLLQSCARQVDWTLVPEYSIAIRRNKRRSSSTLPCSTISDCRTAIGKPRISMTTWKWKSSENSNRATQTTTSSSKPHSVPSSIRMIDPSSMPT